MNNFQLSNQTKTETMLKLSPKSYFTKQVIEDKYFPKHTLTPHEMFVTLVCLEASVQSLLDSRWNCCLDDIVLTAKKTFTHSNVHVSFLKRPAINRRLSIVILKLSSVGKGWQLSRNLIRGRGHKASFTWRYID